METLEFTVGGRQLVADKLDVFTQLFVVRKLAPLLAAAIPPGVGMRDVVAALERSISEVLPGITGALSALPEEDVKALLVKLLSVVRQRQADHAGWSPIMAGGQLMDASLTLPEMLQIAFQSGRFSLAGFTGGLPSLFSGASPKASGQ